jgi:cyanophycinase
MMNTNDNPCPVPKGILLVIGGKEDKEGKEDDKKHADTYIHEEILKSFIALANKPKPLIYVMTSGSSEPEEIIKEYKDSFSKLGSMDIQHVHHDARPQVLESNFKEIVDKADAIFLAGGDQLKLTSLYGGTPFLTALKEKYISESVVIAGTSAGAMAMSTPMIYAGNDEVQQIAGEVKITTGLEFLKDVCVDTHFVNRGRFVRLSQVIATNPTCIGFGIEEDTALIVRNGTEVEIIGSGVVTVIGGFDMTHANISSFNKNMLVSIRDLRVHLLSKGDKYKIAITNPPHK